MENKEEEEAGFCMVCNGKNMFHKEKSDDVEGAFVEKRNMEVTSLKFRAAVFFQFESVGYTCIQ